MGLGRKLKRLWQSLFQSSRLDAELDEELRAYLDGLIEKKIQSGMDPAAARRAAMLEMGGLRQVRADVQRVRTGAAIDALWQDVRFTCRALARRPAFVIVATLTFGLGIGANTAIFSVVNATLIQPLPYKDSNQLAFVWGSMNTENYGRGPLSGPELFDLRRGGSLFSDFGGIWQNTATLTGEGQAEELRIGWVTGNFFKVLGAEAAIGRTFEEADERRGAATSILLSWPVWQRRYGSDPSIVGRTVLVYGQPALVIGVMPQDFRLLFPREASVPEDLEAWIPFGSDLPNRPRRQNFMRVVARMKPGVSLVEARGQVSQIAARISHDYPQYGTVGRIFNLVGLQSDGTREIRPRLLALLGGVGILLLIACLNVASLLIARAAARTKETAVRLAIGAGHRQIVRQCLVEGLVLAAAGCLVGVLFGELSLRVLVAFRPTALNRLGSAQIDGTVLAFTAAAAVFWGILFSLAPMVEVLRTDVIGGVLGSSHRSRGVRYRTRAALVTLQVALSAVLLVGAGLLIRTFVSIQQVDPGYTWDRTVTFRLSPPFDQYDSQVSTNAFHARLQAQISSLPGVVGVGAVSHLPFDKIPNWGSPYYISEGQDPLTAPFADYRSVSPGYFETMGAHLLEGRFFTEADNSQSQPVIIIDDLVAKRSWPRWPAESAIGKRISVDPSVSGNRRLWFTVVGVVRHLRIKSLVEDLSDQVYMSIRQAQRPTTYVVRTTGDPAELAGSIRARLHEFEPLAPVYDIHPLDEYLTAARSGQRFTMMLAAAFALVALALAFVGVFGLVSYSVNTRRYEFGVRLALGARPAQIYRLILREGLTLVVLGLSLGISVAAMVSYFLKSQLFGVSAFDVPTYVVALAVISIAGMGACWLPARRASTLNLSDVMRAE
jgi:predicted permease